MTFSATTFVSVSGNYQKRAGSRKVRLYKIMHGKRSPNLSTLRAIIHALRLLYRTTEGEFIGLIVARFGL